MSVLECIKSSLNKIKEKTIKIDNTDQLRDYLQNYGQDLDLSSLLELLRKMTFDDIKNDVDVSYSDDDITYHNVLDDAPHYSVGIFFMPKGTTIPLHDHIDLLVFSKTLFGCLQITSYDKVDPNDKNVKNFEVKITESVTYTSEDVSILTPEHKNYHQITALEDSALFDVLIPDYGANDCNYYKVSKLLDKYYFKMIES